MELRTYLDKDNYLKQSNVLVDRPIVPGAQVIYVPIINNMDLRFGIVVAVHGGQVDVLWQDFVERDGIEFGALRKRLGIMLPEERRAAKRVAREKYRQEKHDEVGAQENGGCTLRVTIVP